MEGSGTSNAMQHEVVILLLVCALNDGVQLVHVRSLPIKGHDPTVQQNVKDLDGAIQWAMIVQEADAVASLSALNIHAQFKSQ